MLSDNQIWLGTSKDGPVLLSPKMANRHGLISGATGTGKTVTLQVLAEGFSRLGVPVFLADVKGDLAGLSMPGEPNDKLRDRLARCGADEGYRAQACPVALWDVFGKDGCPVRTTVSQMGPLLLGRMLRLNETQEGVLHLVFRIADDEGLLLIDLKDLRSMLNYVGERAGDYTLRYGNIGKQSVGAIQRAIAVLEEQDGNRFFGEPALDLGDWFLRDEEGRGIINILASNQLFLRPQLYSSYLLWMLGELYELLPEQGDSEKPQMVFFFDEAHLLFEDCPKALLDKVELTVRLIRSKGVGVFFITQNPTDLPSSVLSQLGARVQHALRAFTPQEQKVIRAAAQTFRPNPDFNMEETITSLGTGEALISFLREDGAPEVTAKALILPPESKIGAISDSLRKTLIETAEFKDKYEKVFDRESAYEVLAARFVSQGAFTRVPEAVDAPAGAGFKVFDPKTGQYVDKQMPLSRFSPAAVQQPREPEYQPQPAQYQPQQPQAPRPVPARAQAAPAPVLYYNQATGQYEPVNQPVPAARGRVAAPRTQRTVQSSGEKMIERFTNSTLSGAGYAVGRSLTRNILGVFGIK